MSKKRGGDFQNEAARRWRNINKVPLMKQKEIFQLLDKDIETILAQVAETRKGKPYPDYVANGFANLSTAYWFYRFVCENVKTKKDHIKTRLTEEQVKSLLTIFADVHSKTMSGVYTSQTQDQPERTAYITKAFVRLVPDLYRLTGKLEGLSKASRRDLVIQIWGDPVHKFKYIHRKINDSTSSDKVKLKFLKRAYGKRYIAAVGAAMTTEGNGSDCLAMIFDDLMSVKKKKRGPYIQAYAEAYKRNGPSRYFRMDRSFYDKNKKMIKLLIGTKKHPERAIDVGYRKAFKDMKKGKPPEKSRDRKDNRPPWKQNNDRRNKAA